MKKQSEFELLDEIGKKLTQALRTLEMASKMNLNISPNSIAAHLLEIKSIVNQLKTRLIELKRGGETL